MDSWYQQTEVSEAELSTAVHELTNILESTQPMEVDPPPGLAFLDNKPEMGVQAIYSIFDSRMPELLNKEPVPTSPFTV